MALWEKINDKCWAMLDWLWDRHIPIGAVFEKLRIPPVLFPLGIVLILLVLFWLFLVPHAGSPCGDGICLAPDETCKACPLDCGQCTAQNATGLILTVDVIGNVSEPVTIEVQDKDGNTLSSVTDRKAVFEFPNMASQLVKVRVSCPNGKEQTSRPKTIKGGDSTIDVILPEGCFDYIIDTNDQPMQTFGNIVAQVADADTNQPVDALVSAVRTSDGLEEASGLAEAGTVTISVRSDNLYYLVATTAGYNSYDGSQDQEGRFYMLSGDTVYKSISLRSTGAVESAIGTLRVCAKSGNAPLSGSRISVLEVGGSELQHASLTPSDNGCVIFEIPAGKNVKATVTSPPAGCTSPGFSQGITIVPDSQSSANLQVSCGNPAYVKVIVHDAQGNILTDQATITLWEAVTQNQIPGSASDGSLSQGSSGYTEEITVPANTLVQAKASGVPLGFVDTVSGPATFLPNEHGSIDIVLGDQSRGQFTFLGASIVYTPAQPGSPIQVFIQQIIFNQTVLTNENSQVVMIINGKTYNATYSSP